MRQVLSFRHSWLVSVLSLTPSFQGSNPCSAGFETRKLMLASFLHYGEDIGTLTSESLSRDAKTHREDAGSIVFLAIQNKKNVLH